MRTDLALVFNDSEYFSICFHLAPISLGPDLTGDRRSAGRASPALLRALSRATGPKGPFDGACPSVTVRIQKVFTFHWFHLHRDFNCTYDDNATLNDLLFQPSCPLQNSMVYITDI